MVAAGCSHPDPCHKRPYWDDFDGRHDDPLRELDDLHHHLGMVFLGRIRSKI